MESVMKSWSVKFPIYQVIFMLFSLRVKQLVFADLNQPKNTNFLSYRSIKHIVLCVRKPFFLLVSKRTFLSKHTSNSLPPFWNKRMYIKNIILLDILSHGIIHQLIHKLNLWFNLLLGNTKLFPGVKDPQKRRISHLN